MSGSPPIDGQEHNHPWNINRGIYLGNRVYDQLTSGCPDSPRSPGYNAPGFFNEYCGPRHLLTIGPNGSGKTRRLLVPNLYRLTDWSTLVIDLKGELAVWTAQHRVDKGSKVITFDPFGVIERRYPELVIKLPCLKSIGLNPIAILDPKSDDFPDDAKAIGEALIKAESKDEAYWSKSAQALISGLVMVLAVTHHIDGDPKNLGDLRKIIGLPPNELGSYIKGRIKSYGSEYPAIAAKLCRFAEINPETRELMSILSTAVTHTDWLDSVPMTRNSIGNNINFTDMKKHPVTVYLVLPPRYLVSHATWLRLMITTILMPLIRSTSEGVPVLLMLDEFAQLGRLEVIERNMALLRGYGIKLWAILQDLSQIKDSYGTRWESFIGNAGVVQSFAPQDVTTREYLAKLSGRRLYWINTTSETTGQHFSNYNISHSTSIQTGVTHVTDHVYLEQDLALMGDGQSVLFEAGQTPRRTWLPDPTKMTNGCQHMLAKADATARRCEVAD